MLQKYFPNNMKKFLIVGILILVPLVLGGCIPSVNTGGSRSQSSPEYAQGAIVEGFPSLPLYEEAVVIESFGFNGKYGAAFVVDESLAKVVSFYSGSLKNLNWDVNLVQNSGTNYVFEIKNSGTKGEVIVNTASDGKKTAITMSVEPR